MLILHVNTMLLISYTFINRILVFQNILHFPQSPHLIHLQCIYHNTYASFHLLYLLYFCIKEQFRLYLDYVK